MKKMIVIFILLLGMQGIIVEAMSDTDLVKIDKPTLEEAHKILGIPEKYEESDVKKAFINFSRKYHPDKFIDSQEQERATKIFKVGGQAKDLLEAELETQEFIRQNWPKTLEQAANNLGVGSRASEEQVKSAYNKLLQKYDLKNYSTFLEKLKAGAKGKLVQASYDFFNTHFDQQKKEKLRWQQQQKYQPQEQKKEGVSPEEEKKFLGAWDIQIINPTELGAVVRVRYETGTTEEFILEAGQSKTLPVRRNNIVSIIFYGNKPSKTWNPFFRTEYEVYEDKRSELMLARMNKKTGPIEFIVTLEIGDKGTLKESRREIKK